MDSTILPALRQRDASAPVVLVSAPKVPLFDIHDAAAVAQRIRAHFRAGRSLRSIALDLSGFGCQTRLAARAGLSRYTGRAIAAGRAMRDGHCAAMLCHRCHGRAQQQRAAARWIKGPDVHIGVEFPDEN